MHRCHLPFLRERHHGDRQASYSDACRRGHPPHQFNALELAAHEALAFTKMDWNNDALYDPVPMSIRYSQKLARTIANVPDLPRNVYSYRLFM